MRHSIGQYSIGHQGTVGIVLEAKEKGLIDVIKPLLIRLRDNGMHLGESLITLARIREIRIIRDSDNYRRPNTKTS